MMTLGKKIYALRTEKGMTQEQLAERLGVSRQSVSKYEYNQSTPELEKIKLLAEIFEVTPDDLINDTIDLPKTNVSKTASGQHNFMGDSADAMADPNMNETEKNSPSMQFVIEELVKKTDALQTQYNRLNRMFKIALAIILIGALAASVLIVLSATGIYGHVQQIQPQTAYIDSSDYEEPLLDQTFSSYEYGVKALNYHKTDNTVDYFVCCTPIHYNNDTIISALLTFDNGKVYSGILSESNGTFSGTITLPLTADNFSLNLLVDNQGEKQNMEVDDYPLNLLNYLDWMPSVSIESAKETYKKNGIASSSGEMYLQAGESNHADILPFISGIRVVFRTDDSVLYEYALTKEEVEDIQKGFGPRISYAFDRDNESLEKTLILSIEYDNSLIGKRLRCEFDSPFLSEGEAFPVEGENYSSFKMIDGDMPAAAND